MALLLDRHLESGQRANEADICSSLQKETGLGGHRRTCSLLTARLAEFSPIAESPEARGEAASPLVSKSTTDTAEAALTTPLPVPPTAAAASPAIASITAALKRGRLQGLSSPAVSLDPDHLASAELSDLQQLLRVCNQSVRSSVAILSGRCLIRL